MKAGRAPRPPPAERPANPARTGELAGPADPSPAPRGTPDAGQPTSRGGHGGDRSRPAHATEQGAARRNTPGTERGVRGGEHAPEDNDPGPNNGTAGQRARNDAPPAQMEVDQAPRPAGSERDPKREDQPGAQNNTADSLDRAPAAAAGQKAGAEPGAAYPAGDRKPAGTQMPTTDIGLEHRSASDQLAGPDSPTPAGQPTSGGQPAPESQWELDTRRDEPTPQDVARAAQEMWKAHANALRGGNHKAARRIEDALDSLGAAGVEVIDHTGEPFDPGLDITVVAYEPRPGLDREIVVRTMTPTVLLNGRRVGKGEVIVGTPDDMNEPTASNKKNAQNGHAPTKRYSTPNGLPSSESGLSDARAHLARAQKNSAQRNGTPDERVLNRRLRDAAEALGAQPDAPVAEDQPGAFDDPNRLDEEHAPAAGEGEPADASPRRPLTGAGSPHSPPETAVPEPLEGTRRVDSMPDEAPPRS